jgi:glycosyltransferase involved in cell wall biosynthesis
MDELVSVVITTKNEEKNIKNILKSIEIQSYKNIEIILVDNYSSDKTKEIANNFNVKTYDCGNERSAQRNFGLKKSKGELALYLDADMILTPGLIESLVNKINISKINGYYIKENILGKSLFNLSRKFEREFYEGSNIDAIRFFEKRCFNELDGFDTNITGQEDWDFSIRFNQNYNSNLLEELINKKLLNDNYDFYKKFIDVSKLKYECVLHNEIGFKLNDHIKKKIYYLKTFSEYKKKYNQTEYFRKQFTFMGRLSFFLNFKNFIKILKYPHLFFLMIYFKLIIFFRAGFNKI